MTQNSSPKFKIGILDENNISLKLLHFRFTTLTVYATKWPSVLGFYLKCFKPFGWYIFLKEKRLSLPAFTKWKLNLNFHKGKSYVRSWVAAVAVRITVFNFIHPKIEVFEKGRGEKNLRFALRKTRLLNKQDRFKTSFKITVRTGL